MSAHPFNEEDRQKEKKESLEQVMHVPQRAETWKLTIQTANLVNNNNNNSNNNNNNNK